MADGLTEENEKYLKLVMERFEVDREKAIRMIKKFMRILK